MCMKVFVREKLDQSGQQQGRESLLGSLNSRDRGNGFLSKVWVRLRKPIRVGQHPGPSHSRELFSPQA